MVPFSMTLSDLYQDFQGHVIIEVEYLKNLACYGQSYYRIAIGKPHIIYRMVPFSMTLSDLYQDFKVTTFMKSNI